MFMQLNKQVKQKPKPNNKFQTTKSFSYLSRNIYTSNVKHLEQQKNTTMLPISFQEVMP